MVVDAHKITPGQIRAARTLAGLTHYDMVEATGLSLATVKRAETDRVVSISEKAICAICRALERAGVTFIPEGPDGGPGVRMRGQGGDR